MVCVDSDMPSVGRGVFVTDGNVPDDQPNAEDLVHPS